MNTLPPWTVIVFFVVVIALALLRFFLPGRGRTGQGRALYLIVRIVLIVVMLGFLAYRYWSGQHH